MARAILSALFTLGGIAGFTARAADTHAIDAPASLPASEIATPPDLPALGKWMFDRDGSIAHWLGQMVGGKKLHEPINVILIDVSSASPDQARARLTRAAKIAGYPVRMGHSTGYRGFIDGDLYSQLPQGRDDAFSNRLFEETNNHGRIFGPYASGSGYVFIGAFSRESVDLIRDPPHRYASFNMARDDFARALAERAGFQHSGMAFLDNAISNDPQVTTGDHDGHAVVLTLK
ncbi:MAG: hypothetical protein AB7U61_18100 [Methylocystis sp.]